MPKYTIIYKKKEHTLCVTDLARLTGKSITFIRSMMDQGMSAQEAIEAIPNDPARRTKRVNKSQGNSTEGARLARSKAFYSKNKDLINKFNFGGFAKCSNV